MKLRSGSEYWPQLGTQAPEAVRLDRNLDCDVVIVGGGITGALLADAMVEAGMQTILLDRRAGLVSGSTVASTGLLQYELDTSLVELIDQVGPADARRAYQLTYQSFERFEALVEGIGDDCGYIRRPSLFLACESADLDQFAAEVSARQAIGIDAELLDRAALKHQFGLDRHGAILSSRAAQIDPFRFASRLLDRAIGRGLRAFVQSEVNRFEPADGGVILHVVSANGGNSQVRCRHVLFATGYETPTFLDSTLTEMKSTYAMVTPPLPAGLEPWPGRALIWESADPYFYLRTTIDGRIIAGGCDDEFIDADRRDALKDKKAELISERLAKLLPHLERDWLAPDRAWAGTFAETRDGMPIIGPHPDYPNGYFAMGYGGNGITFSLIAANLLGHRITTGKPSPDERIFRFGRGGSA